MEGNEALLVVDMLYDFVDPNGVLYCGKAASSIIPFVKEEIERQRGARDPIIYICDRHRNDDPEFELFPPHCIAGSRGAEVYEPLAPRPEDHIVYKRRYSGFFGTDLDLLLRELKITKIKVVGVCTNICVLYTVADARMRSYEVLVDSRGVASFDEEAHSWALKEMEKTLGAKVVK